MNSPITPGALLSADSVFERFVDQVFSPILQLIIGGSLVVYFFTVFMYFWMSHTGKQVEAQKLLRTHILYGTIGLFILFSIGGILGVFGDWFGNGETIILGPGR